MLVDRSEMSYKKRSDVLNYFIVDGEKKEKCTWCTIFWHTMEEQSTCESI